MKRILGLLILLVSFVLFTSCNKKIDLDGHYRLQNAFYYISTGEKYIQGQNVQPTENSLLKIEDNKLLIQNKDYGELKTKRQKVQFFDETKFEFDFKNDDFKKAFSKVSRCYYVTKEVNVHPSEVNEANIFDYCFYKVNKEYYLVVFEMENDEIIFYKGFKVIKDDNVETSIEIDDFSDIEVKYYVDVTKYFEKYSLSNDDLNKLNNIITKYKYQKYTRNSFIYDNSDDPEKLVIEGNYSYTDSNSLMFTNKVNVENASTSFIIYFDSKIVIMNDNYVYESDGTKLITLITDEDVSEIRKIFEGKAIEKEVTLEWNGQYIPDVTWYDNESVSEILSIVKNRKTIDVDFYYEDYFIRGNFEEITSNNGTYDLEIGDIVLVRNQYIMIVLGENENTKNVSCTKLGKIGNMDTKYYLEYAWTITFSLGYNFSE